MAEKIKKETLHAKGIDIEIYTEDYQNEYISLTDIAKYRNGDDPRFVIQNWMRNRNTIGRGYTWLRNVEGLRGRCGCARGSQQILVRNR